MILFDNWQISVTGLVARQYDNLSRRIDVTGDLPEGFTWSLLVQCGGNADTILLEPAEKGIGAVLTADNLSEAGEYYFQLRGILEADGVTTRHTNVVSAFVPESLTGLGTWPEVPTEFAQMEARILELYQHPPIPGSNGYWLVWDTDKGEYVESQLALPDVSVGPQGPAGFSPTVSLTETADGVRIDVTDQEGTESATIKNGQDGAPGKDGAPGTDGAPGKDGSDGQAATLELTGAESLPAGSTPTVVEQAGSTAQARKYLLQIPSGADGKDGQPGQDGAAATVTISRIDLLAYGAAPTVTELDGSTSGARVYALGIPAGKPGDMGAPGADGVSSTVTVARNEADTGAVITAANADGTTTSVEVLDGADGDTYTLPIASSSQLGGVQPVAKTDAMTQSVGVDETGALFTAPGSGGGGGLKLIAHLELTEDVTPTRSAWTSFADGETFGILKRIIFSGKIVGASVSTAEGAARPVLNWSNLSGCPYVGQKAGNKRWWMCEIDIGEHFSKIKSAISSTVPPNSETNFNWSLNVPVYFLQQEIQSIGLHFMSSAATGFGPGTDLYVWGEKA